MAGKIPNDPIMCLSFVNTQLRDFYPDLDELCSAFDTERSELEKKLQAVGYTYDQRKEPVPLGHGQALRWQSC